MSTETPADAEPSEEPNDGTAVSPEAVAELQARIDDLETELADLRAEREADSDKMVIIATKGTLDMAYPPLILASTAAAFGYDVTVFHTFWGLDIVHEENSKNLKLSSVGNPNMPVPNAIAALPGMDRMTTRMMRGKIEANDVATVEELVRTSLDSGVDLQACQMTIDLLGYDEDDFYDGVTTGVGAASAFQEMQEADIQLLV
ncbi:DsrE domain protein [Natronomonas pharaonis DSM 2160]|uniref:DsrE domain protein n=1 Tax=Natronomonas pharaonis (strain ATCC 35678 / DSM 2160 / CIP 103997 / JCM 8858 / NBRC 14720 / NCIMB 2260 / Gabara) TaxID=348780 RepID=A0A1U7EUD6_NATPD|nr:DsrE/DsrF/DrsH-like family protein [Natronomonas pharaonis]CAI48579.1 DsrE domain protein [Natronomonas pharaonis DSM 2160]